MRLRRGVCGALLLAFACGLSSTSGANAAAVTVGQLFEPTATSTCGEATVLQTGVGAGTSYTVPAAGVITSWSFEEGAGIVPGLKLKVARSGGSGLYKIVGEATAVSQGADTIDTYSTHISVKAGDLIGIFSTGGYCDEVTGNSADSFVSTYYDVPPGMTAGFDSSTGAKWPVSVRVALDCVVPNLKGKTLAAAKKALTKASCTLGTVAPKGQTKGTVKSQLPLAGKMLAPGAKVNVQLG